MQQTFHINPIGVIHQAEDGTARLEIDARYADALLGIASFSHVMVYYWFDHNDTPEKRAVLQVHPRKDNRIPLTGVFATHSPLRPNLIAATRCRLRSVRGTTLFVDQIDAFDGSPLIDIKCYIPPDIDPGDVVVPEWAKQR